MTKLPVDLVAFDLTGTLLREDGVILNAFKEALSTHGIPFTDADLSAMRGAGKGSVFVALAERAFQGQRSPESMRSAAEGAYASFRRLIRETYTNSPVEPIPGAEQTVAWLRERGVKVGATTGLDSELRDCELGGIGWSEGFFDCKVGSDEVPTGRPAPYMIFLSMMRAGVTDVRRVAVVGDTPNDLMAGTNAGVGWVVGVLSGSHRLEALGATPHTHILNSVADLPRILES